MTKQPPERPDAQESEKHSLHVPLNDIDVVRLASLDVHLVVENHDETLPDGTPLLELMTDDPNVLRLLSLETPEVHERKERMLVVGQNFLVQVAHPAGVRHRESLNAPEVPDELLQSRRWREGDVDTSPQGLPVVIARVPRGTRLEVADCLQSYLDHDGPLKVEVNADQWATITPPSSDANKEVAYEPFREPDHRRVAVYDRNDTDEHDRLLADEVEWAANLQRMLDDHQSSRPNILIAPLGRVRVGGQEPPVWLRGEDLQWLRNCSALTEATIGCDDGRSEVTIDDQLLPGHRVPPRIVSHAGPEHIEVQRALDAYSRAHSGELERHRERVAEEFAKQGIRPLRGQQWPFESGAGHESTRGPAHSADDLSRSTGSGRRQRREPEPSASDADDDLPSNPQRAPRRPVHGNGSPSGLPEIDLGDLGVGRRHGPRPGPRSWDGP